ncbi:hypothetical protein CBL_04022 [Carabus blaptoides fortunei]
MIINSSSHNEHGTLVKNGLDFNTVPTAKTNAFSRAKQNNVPWACTGKKPKISNETKVQRGEKMKNKTRKRNIHLATSPNYECFVVFVLPVKTVAAVVCVLCLLSPEINFLQQQSTANASYYYVPQILALFYESHFHPCTEQMHY